MRRCLLAIFILMSSTQVGFPVTGQATLRPVDLRCEYRTNPLGVDALSPRLSWKLDAIHPSARGLSQSAYRILAASSQAGLQRN